MKKRGFTILQLIIMAVPLIVLLIFILFWQARGGAIFGSAYTEYELKAKAKSCVVGAEISIAKPFDNDFGGLQGDTLPDGCDFCKGGDDRMDEDTDGIPDACDDDPKNRPPRNKRLKEICENAQLAKQHGCTPEWNKKTEQCLLKGCYGKTSNTLPRLST